MDRLRSGMVVIAAVLGFLGLVLLGEAQSSARRPLRAARQGAAPARELGSGAPPACSATQPGRLGFFCAIDLGPAYARAVRSGGATR